ncbi:T9SS type A sorting domain-containing protein [Aequorivita viscosa]|nr:T9SS type A sorting domain-containing protein [Aequorivita viscosa]
MMKKLQIYLVLLLVSITVAQAQTYPTTNWSDLADVSWYDAAQDEFTLSTAETLAGLAQLVADGNSFEGKAILIVADIDLDGNLWRPIGVDVNIPFSGTVDGNDYTISNLWVNMPTEEMAGLFGHTESASFANIHIDTANIIGDDNTGTLVANLFDNGSVVNCSAINVNVTGEYSTGGLVGGFLTNSSISKSHAIGDVVGYGQVGGLAGTGWDSITVTECYSEGTVTADFLTGGLIGSFPFAFTGESVVDNSYSRSSVVALAERAGGLIGGGDNALLIKNSYATGTVSSPDIAGAVIGLWGMINAENLYFDTETSGMTEGVGVIQGPPVTPDITEKTTTEMKTTELVDLLNAGSTAAPWSLDASRNDGYPVLNAVLSVQDNNLDAASVKVYPTIFENTFSVSSTLGLQSYSIYSYTGALISKGILDNTVSTVNAANLSTGVYILKISTAEGTITKKIIKK